MGLKSFKKVAIISIIFILGVGTFIGCNKKGTNGKNKKIIDTRILRMDHEEEQKIIDRLKQTTNLEFEIGPPTLVGATNNIGPALGGLSEYIPRLPQYGELDERIKLICTFVREQMNQSIPEKERPDRLDFGIAPTKKDDKFNGEFGYYSPKIKGNKNQDGVVWCDYTVYASPDVLSILIVHEIYHALTARTYMIENNLSREAMELRMKDEEFYFQFEKSAWLGTVLFYSFLAHTGGINCRLVKRLLVDILALDIVSQAAVSYNKGTEAWETFIRQHMIKSRP